MDIDDLKLFLSVAATGSFSRAAKLSNVTQSTVSKRIFLLELYLGTRLFERTGRGARLTEEGKILVPRAESLVREADGFASAFRTEVAQPQGTVRLAVQASIAWPLVWKLYLRLNRDFPFIRLQVVEAPTQQIVKLIQDNLVDLGILSEWGKEELPQVEPLFSLQQFLVAPRGDPVACSHEVPFSRLEGLPLVISPMPNGSRILIEEAAKQIGVALNVVLEVHSVHLIKKLVREGVGYTIASRESVVEELNKGEIIASPIASPILTQQFYLSMTNLRQKLGSSGVVAGLVRELARC